MRIPGAMFASRAEHGEGGAAIHRRSALRAVIAYPRPAATAATPFAMPGWAPSRRSFHEIDQPPASGLPTTGQVSPRVSAATSLGLRSSDRWTDAVVER